jgi:DNA-binding beta-propeller fold protein YncE
LFGTFDVGGGPLGIAFDGHQIWVANLSSSTLTVLSAGDGSLVGTVEARQTPSHVISAAGYIWVTDGGTNSVQKVVARTLADKGRIPCGGLSPWGLAWDGSNIWVANFSSDNVARINLAQP